MHRIAATALTVMTALAPLSVIAPAAQAESVRVDDARDDVVDGRFRVPYDRSLADIHSTTLTHDSDRVVVELEMTKVIVQGQQILTATARLATPAETFTLVGRKEHPTKTVELMRDGADSAENCPDLSFSLRPASDTIVLSAPRSCLGTPDSVRFGAGVGMIWPNPVNSYDDARRKGGITPTRPLDPKIGKREVGPGETA